MIENKKLLIGEAIALVIIIALTVSIFFVDLDLGVFKIISKDTIVNEYDSLKATDTKLTSTKLRYNSSLKALETAKTEYTKQKEQYDAITNETIEIIKEATVDEKYNIDYMWIKLGNYATSNNLILTLVEPGGTVSNTDTKEPDTQVTSKTDSESKAAADNNSTNAPSTTQPTSGNELSIKVVGNYTNVSEFIFELENDKELRFKLDKIKMEYAGNNQITATFAVKNLVFKK